jgi:hypothetical protein
MMEVHSMDRQDERLETGEKSFVIAVVVALATELITTSFGLALAFHWTGLLIGAVSAVLLVYLANWTYTGDRNGFKGLLALAGFEVVVAAVALTSALTGPAATGLAGVLGLPGAGLAACKLAAYLILEATLLFCGPVDEFLAYKRGEELEAAAPAVQPSGVTVPLTDPEAQSLDRLGTLLRAAGWVLVVVGVLRLFGPAGDDWLARVVSLAEGVVLIAVGLVLQAPASAVDLVRREGADVSYLMYVLGRLKNLFFQQLVLGVVLALVLLGAVIVRLPR